jgi:hypothetical protein
MKSLKGAASCWLLLLYGVNSHTLSMLSDGALPSQPAYQTLSLFFFFFFSPPPFPVLILSNSRDSHFHLEIYGALCMVEELSLNQTLRIANHHP